MNQYYTDAIKDEHMPPAPEKENSTKIASCQSAVSVKKSNMTVRALQFFFMKHLEQNIARNVSFSDIRSSHRRK